MPDVQYGVRYQNWFEPCRDLREAQRMLDEDKGIRLIAREVTYGEWHEIAYPA